MQLLLQRFKSAVENLTQLLIYSRNPEFSLVDTAILFKFFLLLSLLLCTSLEKLSLVSLISQYLLLIISWGTSPLSCANFSL
ncbi:hypothetical protein RchiOBHm_Chr5g0022561 [Rosa chinensis]|uniref:Uncharacterized protein n=1 Tax=Rosa chinensis TaxID=74649 RepID=A0A2P6Q7U4_ROSCH|nr:hypothetical protein RchiOBHm_Chr5g0022561 [Rosa chinensis]